MIVRVCVYDSWCACVRMMFCVCAFEWLVCVRMMVGVCAYDGLCV